MTKSKVRVVKLKSNLQSLKKGSLSVHEYVKRMKKIVKALGASGHHVSNNEPLNYIIDDLRSEFDLVVVHFNSKLDSSIENITLV